MKNLADVFKDVSVLLNTYSNYNDTKKSALEEDCNRILTKYDNLSIVNNLLIHLKQYIIKRSLTNYEEAVFKSMIERENAILLSYYTNYNAYSDQGPITKEFADNECENLVLKRQNIYNFFQGTNLLPFANCINIFFVNAVEKILYGKILNKESN